MLGTFGKSDFPWDGGRLSYPIFLIGLDISALRYLIPSVNTFLTSNLSRDDQGVSQRAFPSSSRD